MVSSVAPGNARNPYHVVLSRGGVDLGLIFCGSDGKADQRQFNRSPMPRSALKTYSGEQQDSDMIEPWTPVTQKDWSGGRGQDDFGLNASKYADANRADTIKAEQIILGGQEKFTTGYRNQKIQMPGNVNMGEKLIGNKYYASQFIPASGFTLAGVEIFIRKNGMPFAGVSIDIFADFGGKPTGAPLKSGFWNSYLLAEDAVSERAYFTLDTPLAVVGGTTYWISVRGEAADDANNCWEVAGSLDLIPLGILSYNAGVTWGDTLYGFFYRAVDAAKPGKAFYFEYKGALFAGFAYRDGTASKIYMNGDQGVATAGGANTLTDGAKVWAANEWSGCVVKLTIGKGSDAVVNYRTVLSNTATQLTMTSNWEIAPDSTSEYVILGSYKWTEITGHGMVGKITDVLVTNFVAYFAMGDGEDLKRMRRYNNAGAWTTEWVTEAGNKATFLQDNQEAPGLKIWKAGRGYPATVAKADAVWGGGAAAIGNLVFAAAIGVGDQGDRITNLTKYGQTPHLWVFKEGSIYEVVDDKPYLLPIPLGTVKDYRNGAAVLWHDVYLYFSLQEGLERYYQNTLDNLGPDTDRGLPKARRGAIVDMVDYPGRIYAAVDAIPNQSGIISSVLCWNGLGWHEVYRAPAEMEIQSLYVQSLPGNLVDRLWIGVDGDLIWVPISLNPLTDSGYLYSHEGTIETSWIYLGLHQVEKFFNALRLGSELLVAGQQQVTLDYKLDNDATWTKVTGTFNTSNSQELSLGAELIGRRVKFRLHLATTDNTKTPKIMSAVIEALAWVPTKYITSIQFRVADNDINLNGEPDAMTKATKVSTLEGWTVRPLPVTMTAYTETLHNKTVFVDAASIRMVGKVMEENREVEIYQLNLIER